MNLPSLNADVMLRTLNKHGVDYLLIGGMNFLLVHSSATLTYDVDVWIADAAENRGRLNEALRELGAAWGPDDSSWKPVDSDPSWLTRRSVFCLTTTQGALDVFREVFGLEGMYDECKARASLRRMTSDIEFYSLSDEDMIQCQEALDPGQRKNERVRLLKERLSQRGNRAP